MRTFFPLMTRHFTGIILVFCLLPGLAAAGPLRDLLKPGHGTGIAGETDNRDGIATDADLPAGVRRQQDIAYGSDPRQRMDVYLPREAKGAPVILMVHGGAWRLGDKAMPRVVNNKVARWVPRGFILVSANYRLLPGTAPLEQAADIARALAKTQSLAPGWGGDPGKVILMGHSAGAHLVALLSASPALARQQGARPWLGSVALDSAALDVVQIMQRRHPRFYDAAFGKDPDYWQATSPRHQLTNIAPPLLAVCSSQRDDSCPQARQFMAQAASLGVQVRMLEQDLSHQAINEELGRPGAYTDAVEAYMASLNDTLPALQGAAPTAP